jgi:hypothetical protein
MTRDQLIAEKNVVDEKLRDAKVAVATAKREACASGKFLPPGELAEMERTVNRLIVRSHQLARLMADARKREHETRGTARDAMFIRLMKEWLTEEEWLDAWAEVDERMEPQMAAD